jgi:hypothetical protein
MKKKHLAISVAILGILLLFLISGCAGAGKNILPSPDSGETTGLPPSDPYQPPAQAKAGDLSVTLKVGWNLIRYPVGNSKKFTAVTMTRNGETKLLNDAVTAGWTQNKVRFMKGRGIQLIGTGTPNAAFLPGGQYYVYSYFNKVLLEFNKPFISDIEPSSAVAGTQVTISGVNFGDAQGVVTFSQGKEAPVTSWSDTMIICTTPEGLETGTLSILAHGSQSNAFSFTVAPPRSWEVVHTLNFNKANDIWCSGPDNIYVTGYDSGWMQAIRHYDGTSWSDIRSTIESQSGNTIYNIYGLWGSGSGNVWLGSEGSGYCFNFNGSAWSMNGPWANYNFDFGGTAPNDVYAATGTPEEFWNSGMGDPATVYRFDGFSWTAVIDLGYPPPGDAKGFKSVWAFTSGDVFAAGYFVDGNWFGEYPEMEINSTTGMICHYNGSSTSSFLTPDPVNGIWGSAPDDVFAAAGTCIYHYNGTAWSPMEGTTGYGAFTGIWGLAHDDVYAMGGNNILHFDGASWTSMEHPAIDAKAIWGWPEGVFVLGNNGTILRY